MELNEMSIKELEAEAAKCLEVSTEKRERRFEIKNILAKRYILREAEKKLAKLTPKEVEALEEKAAEEKAAEGDA